MTKDVMISIHPDWCDLIASKKKTLEVRRTRPKQATPFKCYIYQTKGKSLHAQYVDEEGHLSFNGRGMVIGEFVCDYITRTMDPAGGLVDVVDCEQSCLQPKEIIQYAGGEMLYFWHISGLKMYERTKPISSFEVQKRKNVFRQMERAPQSWCYVRMREG